MLDLVSALDVLVEGAVFVADAVAVPRKRQRGHGIQETGGKPAQAGCKVAWAESRDEGIDHAYRLWPNAGLPGELAQVLPSVRHFEQATSLVTRESTKESVVAGPEITPHVDQLRTYAQAGYDEVYVANMGPHYLPMIEAYGREVLPALAG